MRVGVSDVVSVGVRVRASLIDEEEISGPSGSGGRVQGAGGGVVPLNGELISVHEPVLGRCGDIRRSYTL
jgi:hypothetical protein